MCSKKNFRHGRGSERDKGENSNAAHDSGQVEEYNLYAKIKSMNKIYFDATLLISILWSWLEHFNVSITKMSAVLKFGTIVEDFYKLILAQHEDIFQF